MNQKPPVAVVMIQKKKKKGKKKKEEEEDSKNLVEDLKKQLHDLQQQIAQTDGLLAQNSEVEEELREPDEINNGLEIDVTRLECKDLNHVENKVPMLTDELERKRTKLSTLKIECEEATTGVFKFSQSIADYKKYAADRWTEKQETLKLAEKDEKTLEADIVQLDELEEFVKNEIDFRNLQIKNGKDRLNAHTKRQERYKDPSEQHVSGAEVREMVRKKLASDCTYIASKLQFMAEEIEALNLRLKQTQNSNRNTSNDSLKIERTRLHQMLNKNLLLKLNLPKQR